MRRPILLLLAGAFAMSLLASSYAEAGPVAAATIAPTTTCSNGVDDTPGLGLICDIDIVNHITPSGGTATVTIRECHGAAGDPTAECTTRTDTVNSPVTQVTQCNAATNGGGSTLRCSVTVTNRFVGFDPSESGVTIDQCVGSADGIANSCDPFPANTSGATITQCNGSANGGTLVGLTCTASGMSASDLDVEINQCNGSANGGGSLVICSARIDNTFTAAAPTATPAATAAPTAIPTASPTAAPTASVAPTAAATPRPTSVVDVITGTPASTPAATNTSETPNELLIAAAPSGPAATAPRTDTDAADAIAVATSAPGLLTISTALVILGLALAAAMTGRGWRPGRTGTSKS